MNPAELVALGEAIHQQLGREYYLTGAGLKSQPELQAIYQRHADLLGEPALDAARASGSMPLLEWVIGLRIGRAVAPLEERQLAWEQAAVVHGNEHSVPYLRVPIELANLADRPRRIALDRARGALVASELNDLLQERFELERATLAALEGGDYVAVLSRLAGIALDELGETCGHFLTVTAPLYDDALARLVRRRVGVPVDALLRADVAWAFRAGAYDAAFPNTGLLETALRQMSEMGLDGRQGGRIHFDTDERPGKQPRAFCVPVQVPEEVYLVLRPRGGHTDYRTMWHELGHAMHFASVDRDRSFADRWLGDNSVTEGFAMLWDHLTIDRLWLRRYTSLTASQIEALQFELAVHDLYGVRRYAAKLRYELLLHRGDLGEAFGTQYAERLTDATRFRYSGEDYLADVDPAFYAARYLRAWQLEAALAATLVERFDEDWFRNPAAGPFVHELMSRGQANPADRVALEVTGSPLSFAPVISRLEAMLQ